MRRWKKGLGSDMPVFLMVAESVMNPFPLRQNYDNLKLALHIERKNASFQAVVEDPDTVLLATENMWHAPRTKTPR